VFELRELPVKFGQNCRPGTGCIIVFSLNNVGTGSGLLLVSGQGAGSLCRTAKLPSLVTRDLQAAGSRAGKHRHADRPRMTGNSQVTITPAGNRFPLCFGSLTKLFLSDIF
jgi:hypothetical protein